MNLTDIFQPTTKLRHVDLESVLLGNKDISFVDGSFIPPYDNAVGDSKVGPQTATDYNAANIEANDIGLARQIMSGTRRSCDTYTKNDQAIGRVTAINMRNGFRWQTPKEGGNVVEGQAFAPGQTLMLYPFTTADEDNWKLTNAAQGAGTTRWIYAKIVAVETNTITVEAVAPYTVTTAP